MKTATTDPRDQELELGTDCCGNSLFLGPGLSFLTSPSRPSLNAPHSPVPRSPSSSLHPLCTPLFDAAVGQGLPPGLAGVRGACGSQHESQLRNLGRSQGKPACRVGVGTRQDKA